MLKKGLWRHNFENDPVVTTQPFSDRIYHTYLDPRTKQAERLSHPPGRPCQFCLRRRPRRYREQEQQPTVTAQPSAKAREEEEDEEEDGQVREDTTTSSSSSAAAAAGAAADEVEPGPRDGRRLLLRVRHRLLHLLLPGRPLLLPVLRAHRRAVLRPGPRRRRRGL